MTVGLLATDLAIPLHCVCYNSTSLFISYYPVGLRSNALAVSVHFFINFLLKAFLAHFPHLYLFWVLLANIPVVLAYFTILFLELSWSIYLFYSQGLFDRFFGLPRPNYYILPLITFRAYWPLSQSIEFTNSFPELL